MNFRYQKGQASIEFLVAFAIVVVVFLFFAIVLYQKSIQANEIKTDAAGQRVANSIAEVINSVYIAGQGISQCFTLPNKVSLDEYSVKFYKDEPTVFVYTERQTWVSPLVTPYVNCTMNICSFSDNSTTMRINSTLNAKVSYSEDRIYLSEC